MKKIFLLVALAFMGHQAFSQGFKHGIGTGLLISKPSDADADGLATILYTPRYHFQVGPTSSVSLGIPMTFGFAGGFNWGSNGNTSDIAVGVNLPLMFDYNIGAGALNGLHKRAGFFVGAGFGWHYMYHSYDNTYYENGNYSYNESGVGPAANIGARFHVGKRNHNIEVRAFYMNTPVSDKFDVIGLNCSFNF
ncbi:outer membrane beta-barrel protein [Chitinophaga sp. Hz27]|uniref:outer membrane beta-barrel protein n=1 Tax=Chitinophaga sp. Hz27 TaxID=3347169 RepID=UPI0035E2EDAC